MVSCIRDTKGVLRGVIQMVNKTMGEKITSQDVTEFDALMPSLGEIFKTAEDIRSF